LAAQLASHLDLIRARHGKQRLHCWQILSQPRANALAFCRNRVFLRC
jgi:hypothetical protein